MLKTDIGGLLYNQGLAVATLGTTPIADRALLCRRINLSNESAADDWQVIVGGRELMRFRHLTVGNQRLLHEVTAGLSTRLDFFEYARNVLGIDPTIPVPLGLTITVQSVGGATADIDLEFKEVDPGDAVSYPLNHYQKNTFLLPIAWRLNASQSAAGIIQVDTQTAPPWIPAIFSGLNLPVNWKIELLSLFLESAGVNTFSGAANHQSTLQDIHLFLNQTQIYTRIGHGIPNQGQASAAGSANTVIGQRSGIFPPFEQAFPTDDNVIPLPLVLQGGNTLQILEDLVGDFTGGASYANVLLVAIARVTVPGGTMVAA